MGAANSLSTTTKVILTYRIVSANLLQGSWGGGGGGGCNEPFQKGALGRGLGSSGVARARAQRGTAGPRPAPGPRAHFEKVHCLHRICITPDRRQVCGDEMALSDSTPSIPVRQEVCHIQRHRSRYDRKYVTFNAIGPGTKESMSHSTPSVPVLMFYRSLPDVFIILYLFYILCSLFYILF